MRRVLRPVDGSGIRRILQDAQSLERTGNQVSTGTKSLKGEPTQLWSYMAESAGYLDSISGLLGWPLVFPDALLPRDRRWLKHLMVTPESERWIQLDFKHVDFQRDLARYKNWAESAPKRG